MNKVFQTDSDRLRHLSEMAHIGWFEFDYTQQVLYFSPYIKEMLGENRSQMTVDEYMEMVDENYRSYVKNKYNVKYEEDYCEQTYPITTKTGRKWLRVRMQHIMSNDTDNKVAFGVTQVIDAPDASKKNEISLRLNQSIFRNVFNNIPAGVEVYNQDGILVDVSNRDLEMFGVANRDELLGLSLFKNPVVPQYVLDRIRQEDELDINVYYHFDDVKDYYATTKTGGIELYCKMNKLYDSVGDFQGYVLIMLDNTDRVSARDKIAEFEYFFRVISDYAKVGYSKRNLKTGEVYSIQQWLKNLGLTDEASLNNIESTYANLHPDDRKRILDFYDSMFKGEAQEFKGEIRVKRPDEPNKWYWISIYVTVNNNSTEHGAEAIGMSYDITALKEAEAEMRTARDKALDADKLKSAFLANMSHEIRTPLNAIVGFSGLIAESDDPEEKLEYQNIVEENNAILLQLIGDILDLSKIEAGTLEYNMTPVDANKLCKDVIQSTSMKCRPGVELLFDRHLDELQIITDKYRLNQVIVNFVNNAIKFTYHGNIKLGYDQTDAGKVRFYVQDTGLGISAEQKEAVFDRFVKLNAFAQGTGLGLSICKGIAERLGGSVGVDSELGKGSCFWIEMPLECK